MHRHHHHHYQTLISFTFDSHLKSAEVMLRFTSVVFTNHLGRQNHNYYCDDDAREVWNHHYQPDH